MDFRGIREDLLKISIDDFASEYELSVSDVESMDKTNEVPLSLIKLISQKSGYSVGMLLKYDGINPIHDNAAQTPTSDKIEYKISRFTCEEAESIAPQFETWLQDNKQYLNLSDRVNRWIKENAIWCLEEFDKRQQESGQEAEITTEDVIEFFERLSAVSQNEIVRLQFIIDNRNMCQRIVKNAVDLEVTRLIKEDSVIEKSVKALSIVRNKHLKETYAVLSKMTSVDYIEEVMKRNLIEVEFIIEIKKALNQKKDSYLEDVNAVVHCDEGLLKFYNTELNVIFAGVPDLNCFSAENVYYKYFKYGINHPDDLNVKPPVLGGEVKTDPKTNVVKRQIKGFSRDVAFDMFPPLAIYDAIASAGSKLKAAKELSKYIIEHHIIDDLKSQIVYYSDIYLASAKYALKGVKDDWKIYFNETIDLVQKDDRDIRCMIVDEERKILIAKSVKEAFKGE